MVVLDPVLRRVEKARGMSPEERIRKAVRLGERYRRFVMRIDPHEWEKVLARSQESKRAFWNAVLAIRDRQE